MTYKFEDFEQQLKHEMLSNRWTVNVDVLDEDLPESMKAIFDRLLNESAEDYTKNYIRDIGVEPNMKDVNCDTFLYIRQYIDGVYEYFLCLALRCTTNGHMYGDKSYIIGATEKKLSHDFVTYIRDLFRKRSQDELYDMRLQMLPEFINGRQWLDASECDPMDEHLAIMDKDGNIYKPLKEGADIVFCDGKFCEKDITLITPIDDFEVSKWRYLDDEDFKDAE